LTYGIDGRLVLNQQIFSYPEILDLADIFEKYKGSESIGSKYKLAAVIEHMGS